MLFGRRNAKSASGSDAREAEPTLASAAGIDGATLAQTATATATGRGTLELSRQDFQKLAREQRRRRSAAVGEIVSLLARAPRYQDMCLKDLRWFLLPAVAAGQYLISERKAAPGKPGGLAAVMLWAKVSTEVDQRLAASTDATLRLQPSEWTSGEIIWVIEVLGETEAIGPLLAQFKRAVLKGQRAKIRAGGRDNPRVVELETTAAP